MKMKNALKPMICLLAVLAMLVSSVIPAFATDSQGLETVTLDENAIYNGIVIPENWQHTATIKSPYQYGNGTSPYLLTQAQGGYAPDVINIDVGRQLFVDDFLIGSTTLTRSYYQAELMEEPLFTESVKYGKSAVLTSGGVFYDMEEKLYKMWYQAGFCGQMAYATSEDGINWEFPIVRGGDGSNIVNRNVKNIAGSSVWLDYNAEDPNERYKMMVRRQDKVVKEEWLDSNNASWGDGTDFAADLYVSADGMRWLKKGQTGLMGDRSTFYYNELLDDWVFSIRYNAKNVQWQTVKQWARTRAYHSGATWLEAATWDWWKEGSDNNPTFWYKADNSDIYAPEIDEVPPHIYNLDAVAYESITLGLFQMWYGPDNGKLGVGQYPKITEIQAGYSRDGFYFERPQSVRGLGNALIPASCEEGAWDYGYLSTTTGGVIVLDDEIRIYYSGMSGKGEKENGDKFIESHAGGSIAYATLRRDGFASMDGTGELTTKDLTVTKDVKYLFVNANTSNGSLRAEILDTNGNVLEGYSKDDCVAFTGNNCCTKLTWNGANDLSFLQGKGFRIRFVMEEGELYSFWLSADPNGASGGAMAAGYAGEKDLDPDLSEQETTNDTTETQDSNDNNGGCKSTVGGVVAILPVIGALAMLRRKEKRSK